MGVPNHCVFMPSHAGLPGIQQCPGAQVFRHGVL